MPLALELFFSPPLSSPSMPLLSEHLLPFLTAQARPRLAVLEHNLL